MWRSRAHCLVLAGHNHEAEPLLDGIGRHKVADLTADPNWGGNIALARARMADARGDDGAALRQLDLAWPTFERAATDPFQARGWKGLDARIDASR